MKTCGKVLNNKLLHIPIITIFGLMKFVAIFLVFLLVIFAQPMLAQITTSSSLDAELLVNKVLLDRHSGIETENIVYDGP